MAKIYSFRPVKLIWWLNIMLIWGYIVVLWWLSLSFFLFHTSIFLFSPKNKQWLTKVKDWWKQNDVQGDHLIRKNGPHQIRVLRNQHRWYQRRQKKALVQVSNDQCNSSFQIWHSKYWCSVTRWYVMMCWWCPRKIFRKREM